MKYPFGWGDVGPEEGAGVAFAINSVKGIDTEL